MFDRTLTNLLKETSATLRHFNKSPEDVLAVMIPARGTNWCDETDQYLDKLPAATATWTEFAKLAKDVDYDDGYGLEEIVTDLTILLRDNTWFTRWEYDGSEGWQYHCPPTMPTETRPLLQSDLQEEYAIEKALERKTFLAGGTMDLDWAGDGDYPTLSWMFGHHGIDPWWCESRRAEQVAKITDESLRGPQLIRGVWR